MFNRKEKELTDLEKLITTHIEHMDGSTPGTEEYTAQAANLKVLIEANAIESNLEKSWVPSADTLALVGGNLVGIIAVLSFERVGIITSKAISFVLKPKI